MNLALIPMLPGVGPTELIILLTIVLLFFGAEKIPELARGLGTGVREFKRGTSGAGEKDEEREPAPGDASRNGTARGGHPYRSEGLSRLGRTGVPDAGDRLTQSSRAGNKTRPGSC